MKKMLSLFCAAGILLTVTSCSKDSLKPAPKSTTNAKSAPSGGTYTAPSTPSGDHQGGCPHSSGGAG